MEVENDEGRKMLTNQILDAIDSVANRVYEWTEGSFSRTLIVFYSYLGTIIFIVIVCILIVEGGE